MKPSTKAIQFIETLAIPVGPKAATTQDDTPIGRGHDILGDHDLGTGVWA